MKTLFYLICILNLFFSNVSSAQLSTSTSLPFDETARVIKVSKDVYFISHDDATDEWPHSNMGIIIGDDAVMVIDADYLPSRARSDISLIRKLTSKPVKYLVYTHWHFDHNNGGVAFADSFPGVRIISERESQKYVELNATWWSKMSTAPNSNRRKALKKLEDEFARGTDTAGVKFSEEEMNKRKKVIAQRINELAELESLRVIEPNMVFDKQLDISLGKKKIQIVDRGKANSPRDVTIYLPDERILFTGDILVQSPLPYAFGSWPLPWVKVLRDLEAMEVKSIVPGHGPLLHDFTYMKQVRRFFEDAITRTEALIRKGKTLVEIQNEIDMSDYLLPPWNRDKEAIEDFKITVNALVERIWRGVRGQG
jgi:cyclase